jgi:anti-anti-sigma factor
VRLAEAKPDRKYSSVACQLKGGTLENDGAIPMVQAAQTWDIEVDRGPDWLFVRPHGLSLRGQESGLAEHVWQLLEQSMTHRVVLELDDIGLLCSTVIGQLVLLQKRIHSQGGMIRLCGLSPVNQRVLAICRLSGCFPQYTDRNDAVMGGRPTHPR